MKMQKTELYSHSTFKPQNLAIITAAYFCINFRGLEGANAEADDLLYQRYMSQRTREIYAERRKFQLEDQKVPEKKFCQWVLYTVVD